MNKNKILVVDDHDDSRQALKVMIEMLGHEVLEASTGEEALQQARDGQPALIFLDISLPKIDGIRVASIIARDLCPGVSIVAITGYEGMHELAIGAGCIEVVKKPVDLSVVRDIISRLYPAL